MIEAEPQNTVKYGYEWDYGASESAIELTCFRNIGFVDGFETGHTRLFHFERAMDLILPEKTPSGAMGYVKSKWSERRVQSFIAEDRKFQTWWGSKSAGKSTDAAAIVFVYYLSAPERTAVQICSTSKGALMKRIWAEVVRFYQSFDPKIMPMEYFRGKPAFQYKLQGQKSYSEKAGIFGRALLRGSVEEAVGEIIGLHNEFNVLIIDELQASRWAGVEAFDNLDSGREAKFLGMGNPVSRLDPLGMASTPKHGWNSINPTLEEWKTVRGHCLYFDGLKSPGIEDPEKYWFLINKSQIDSLRADPGENTPRFYTMARGWIPPESLIQTVFTETLIETNNCRRKVQWADRPVLIAALDGAFTEGGDRCVLQTAYVGMSTEGRPVIELNETVVINLIFSEEETIEAYIVRSVTEYCVSRSISPYHFGLDVTAQQTALAAIFNDKWDKDIFRCNFGGAAIRAQISEKDPRPASEVYYNRATELWYDVRAFALAGQLAGIKDDAIREACSRLVLQKNKKISIETKREYIERTSQSPDIFDAHAIIVALAIERLGLLPGSNQIQVAGQSGFTEAEAEEIEAMDEEENMYHEDDFGDIDDGSIDLY